MSNSSSLNVLRKAKKDSFFLDESDHEDDDFDVDNMDFPLPTDAESSSSANPADTPLSPEQLAQIQALMDTGAVDKGARYVSMEEAEQFKSWMCVYPCYIDGTKTVAEGRRISKEKACVKQPWAKDIVEAVKELRLSQAFEPGKTHPRDWANRGRVRVLFKDNGRFCHPTIRTKNELLIKLAASINKTHAKEESAGNKRSEFSPLSPLTPLSIVMPGMANADPLAGFLGGNDTTESPDQPPSTSSTAPKSKRQEKLAKKPKRVMIRG
ncbi:signal recognition particle subunit [Entomortierella chlamydospora]|uniref:Signal recognition particle subunit n=1 Tax=Entomortierella chlamydospora TaxID=101097 RepID=A0A9P6N3B3_9FUNG|nr:signal recognition particle subunit [Entomortierella chlamydospora]KAG0022077.1 signal recognition particle subunit [Entomortierella chlamydospora]